MLTHVLAGALIVWVVTLCLNEGFITEPVRYYAARLNVKLGYLVQCALCSGFWVGLGTGIVFPAPGLGRPLSGLAYWGLAHLILIVRNYLEVLS